MDRKLYYTTKEVCELCGIAKSTLYFYTSKNFIPMPLCVRNEELHRGNISIYPRKIVKYINKIRAQIKKDNSIENVRVFEFIDYEDLRLRELRRFFDEVEG